MSLWAEKTVPRVPALCRSILRRTSRERFVRNTSKVEREKGGKGDLFKMLSVLDLNCRKKQKGKRKLGDESGFSKILEVAMSHHGYWDRMLDARKIQDTQQKVLLPVGPGGSLRRYCKPNEGGMRPGASIKGSSKEYSDDDVPAKAIIRRFKIHRRVPLLLIAGTDDPLER